MSSRRGGALPPSGAKSSGLAAEAADMENKLMELRKAMEQMRAMRERPKNADTGTYWRNAVPTAGGGTRSTPSTGRSSKIATPLPPVNQSNHPQQQSSGSLDGQNAEPPSMFQHWVSVEVDTASACRTQRRHSQQQQQQQPETPQLSVDGLGRGAAGGWPSSGPSSSSSSHRQHSGGLPPAAMQLAKSMYGRLATDTASTLATGRAAEARQQRGRGGGGRWGGGAGSGTSAGGMGTDAGGDSLQGGGFDEAESHHSFLDALNEWRVANRAGKQQQQQQQQAAPPDQDGPEVNIVGPAPPRQQDAAGVQTDARPLVQRPSSAARQLQQQQQQQAQPTTYFNRLLINSAARQAGQLASSGSFSHAGGSTLLASSASLPLLAAAGSMLTSPGGAPGAFGGLLPPLAAVPGSLDPANQAGSSSSAVYAVEAAMSVAAPARRPLGGAGAAGGSSGWHKGLDILEELERLEVQQHRAALAYDSDEEWAVLLSPPRQHQHGLAGDKGRWAGGSQAQPKQELPVVTTQHGMVGLTKGARLPDAILLPQPDSDRED